MSDESSKDTGVNSGKTSQSVSTADVELEQPASIDYWKSLVEKGNHHFEKKETVKAEQSFLKALKVAEELSPESQAGGDEDLRINLAKSLNNLAALYHAQGKYGFAEELYERCLDVKLDLFGDEHLETALNFHNLAMLYSARRQYEKAEILYKRTLEVREKVLGPTHKELLPVLNNYALMLKKSNRLVEATAVEARARSISSAG